MYHWLVVTFPNMSSNAKPVTVVLIHGPRNPHEKNRQIQRSRTPRHAAEDDFDKEATVERVKTLIQFWGI